MRTTPLYFALAFFCGFRVQAQVLAPSTDSTSSTARTDSVVRPASSASSKKEDPPPKALTLIPVNLGIAPGTSSNGPHPETVRNYVSLDLVAGEAGEIKGVQASIGMNEVHGNVKGVQGAGGLNRVHGNVSGLQASTVNLVDGDVKGYQGAYVLNRVKGDVRGYQGSSFGNLVTGDVYGVQSSSLYGKARTVKGVQFNAVGVADTLYGVQWGVVNWAGRMKGAQFGIVNIIRGGDGAQFGLVNVRPDTRMYAESWVDETRSGHLAFNYGGPHWYSLVEAVGTAKEPETFGMGLGFGLRSASPRNILSLDVSGLGLWAADNAEDACGEDDHAVGSRGDGPGKDCSLNGMVRTRLTVGRHLLGRFAVFGGVSYNALFVPENSSGARLLEPEEAYHWDANGNVRLWPGVFLGVRI